MPSPTSSPMAHPDARLGRGGDGGNEIPELFSMMQRDLAGAKAAMEKTQKDVAGLKVGFADMQKKMGTLATKDDMMVAISALEMRTTANAQDLEKRMIAGLKDLGKEVAVSRESQNTHFYTKVLPAMATLMTIMGTILGFVLS